MAGRVDQVQLVGLAVLRLVEDAHRLGLDRDAALALEVHESSSCACIARGSTVWVVSRMRSASVDFPWSMWAMIEKFRMCAWSATSRRGYEARRPSRPREQLEDLAGLREAQREHDRGVDRAARARARRRARRSGAISASPEQRRRAPCQTP